MTAPSQKYHPEVYRRAVAGLTINNCKDLILLLSKLSQHVKYIDGQRRHVAAVIECAYDLQTRITQVAAMERKYKQRAKDQRRADARKKMRLEREAMANEKSDEVTA